MQFENDTFNSKITETGSRLSDETAEAQQKKGQTMIESTDLHTAAENVENHQHTVEGLQATSTAMQGDS